jgi:hypothetical protein
VKRHCVVVVMGGEVGWACILIANMKLRGSRRLALMISVTRLMEGRGFASYLIMCQYFHRYHGSNLLPFLRMGFSLRSFPRRGVSVFEFIICRQKKYESVNINF